MDNTTAFACLVRRCRGNRSRKEMALALEVSSTKLSSWEEVSNPRFPLETELLNIAEIYGLDFKEISRVWRLSKTAMAEMRKIRRMAKRPRTGKTGEDMFSGRYTVKRFRTRVPRIP